ncbi:MAG: hypothetical protein NVSMB24_26300 [Mucilaginibacter sp.]
MMSINDIIVLLTLIIALVAVINEKNRLHLLLKFNRADYILFAGAFLLINYFVFYPSFEQRGIVIHWLYFKDFGFYEPRHFAYLVTLVGLVYLFYKIYFSFYAFANFEKVEVFYRKQIENREISFLLDLLERYHRADIIRLVASSADAREGAAMDYYLKRYQKKPLKKRVGDWLETKVRNLFPTSWYNRRDYAYNVLNFIINSPGFIDQAANLRPYFFSDIFAGFTRKKRQSFPDDLINAYLTELIKLKNFWLKKELKESENFDGQPDYFHEDNQILSSLIKELSVADVNQVWQPFGSAAVTEIELERRAGDDIAAYYRQETQLSRLYKLFAAVAIFISCLGLYGLVTFMAVQRKKEIGVRKVLGAPVSAILILLSREFTLLISIAFLIASPVAWYFMHNWLKQFAYRINLGPGFFVITIIGSILIAWATVGYTAIKAALANPARSLRNE